MLAYVFMIAAIASEVVGTTLLKKTEGFTRLWPSVGCLGATFLGEPLSVLKVLGVGLIVAGVVVVNLGGAH